jgi:hypothetical protein
MIPATSLFRTARVLFPRLSKGSTNSTTLTSSRTFSCLTTGGRRPNFLAGMRGSAFGGYGKGMGMVGAKEVLGQKAGEQVRGMKVRSSVKKLCEGCKVRYFPLLPFSACLHSDIYLRH